MAFIIGAQGRQVKGHRGSKVKGQGSSAGARFTYMAPPPYRSYGVWKMSKKLKFFYWPCGFCKFWKKNFFPNLNFLTNRAYFGVKKIFFSFFSLLTLLLVSIKNFQTAPISHISTLPESPDSPGRVPTLFVIFPLFQLFQNCNFFNKKNQNFQFFFLAFLNTRRHLEKKKNLTLTFDLDLWDTWDWKVL